MTQLAIDLPHRPALGRADFLVSDCNAGALGWIERWPQWPAPARVLAAVLVKLFADRQVRVAPGVIGFLLRRMERSFAAAGALAERLDRLSLDAGRPIGLALARRVLAESSTAD